MASRGYVILVRNSDDTDLENAVACPTLKVMKEPLLSNLREYLQYKIVLCDQELTYEERKQISVQVNEMSDTIQ